MDSLAEDPSSGGLALVIRASGRLSLPHISTAELPDSSRTSYLAVGVLMQYITGLQPETSSASADTHVQGERFAQLSIEFEGRRFVKSTGLQLCQSMEPASGLERI